MGGTMNDTIRLLAFMAEGLIHRTCRSAVACRRVERYPDLQVVEMVPF
jgi:hypothetical protein